MKRRLTWTVYATPLMTLTTDLGLSIRVSMLEQIELQAKLLNCFLGSNKSNINQSSMSTGDWDLFLGPLEWARAETGGADRWVL